MLGIFNAFFFFSSFKLFLLPVLEDEAMNNLHKKKKERRVKRDRYMEGIYNKDAEYNIINIHVTIVPMEKMRLIIYLIDGAMTEVHEQEPTH